MLMTVLELAGLGPVVYGGYKTFKGVASPTVPDGHFGIGVPKPSHVLAGMVATYILKNIENMNGDRLVLDRDGRKKVLYDRTRNAYYKDKNVIVHAFVEYRDMSSTGGYNQKERQSGLSVSFAGEGYEFEENDRLVIMNAMKKASGLMQAHKNLKALEQREQKAVDIIENIFKPKPEVQPVEAAVEKPTKLRKSSLAKAASDDIDWLDQN